MTGKTSCRSPRVYTLKKAMKDKSSSEPHLSQTHPVARHRKGSFLSLLSADIKATKQLKPNNTNSARTDIKKLLNCFPGFPEKMLEYLLVRHDGNCRKVFSLLVSKGWEPVETKKAFTNADNKYFSLSYYFGPCPSVEKIAEIFKDTPPGSFITYYKQTSATHLTTSTSKEATLDYHFFVCKYESGAIVEKRVPFEVPIVVREVLQLTQPIRAVKRDLSWVPGLSPAS